MSTIYFIKKAVLSEKSYELMEKGKYTFLVNKSANKSQIKKTVEGQFQVNVVDVKMLSKSAKTKKISGTRKTTIVGAGKKALVTLQKGQSIPLFNAKSEKLKAKTTSSKIANQESKTEKKERNIFGKFKKNKDKEKENQ